MTESALDFHTRIHYKSNRFRQLRGFIYVVQYGTVKDAAKAMGVNSSTITMQVQSLEKELKIKLFKKEGLFLKPTPEGERFYHMAVDRLQAIDGLYEEFMFKHSEEEENHIKIAAHQFILSHHLPKYLSMIKEKYANNDKLRFTLYSISYEEAIDKIIKGEIDIVMHDIKEEASPELFAKQWFKEEYVLGLPKGHNLNNKPDAEITWADVAKNNFIIIKGQTANRAIQDISDQYHFKEIVSYVNGSYEMGKYGVASGFGISACPKSYIAEHEKSIISTKNISHLMGFYKSYIGIKKNTTIKPIAKELILLILKDFFNN